MYSCRRDIDFSVPGSSRANRACSWAMSAWADLWTFCVYKDKKDKTSSAARSIPMPGGRAPVPLRSHKEPDGLSTLSGVSLVRVSVANTLYKATAQIITFAFQHGVLWSCENPNRSLFWATSAMKVLQSIPHIETRTHHCMFGSQRRKHTLFVHAVPQLQSVGILCDGSHEHLPWGVLPNGQFATHAEVAYPALLCKAMAAAFRQQIILLGASAPATSIVCSPLPLHQAAQIATSAQKKKRIPPLVPEFARRILVRAPSSCLPSSSTLTADFVLPAEARYLFRLARSYQQSPSVSPAFL